MRKKKSLRWIERRKTKKTHWSSMPFDLLDIVILVLLIGLSVLVLRISFIYAGVNSPSDSAFHNFGISLGLASAFEIGLMLAGLLFVFWVIVSLTRLSVMKTSLTLIIWHIFIFVGIGLLAYGCYSAVIF